MFSLRLAEKQTFLAGYYNLDNELLALKVIPLGHLKSASF